MFNYHDMIVFLFTSSCDMEIRPDVNHFGRSLLGGYSPQYMPDFVLHGVTSDQRLKQCLMADLEHTVLVSTDRTEQHIRKRVYPPPFVDLFGKQYH